MRVPWEIHEGAMGEYYRGLSEMEYGGVYRESEKEREDGEYMVRKRKERW